MRKVTSRFPFYTIISEYLQMATRLSLKLIRCHSSYRQTCKVLFCGHNFSGGYLYSKESIETRLRNRGLPLSEISIVECARDEVDNHLPSSTIIVPWMSKFTVGRLSNAPNLRLIMQFGVGLEGVDIEEATKRGICVSRINSQSTPGNAQSCAEHCIYLATASLRNVNELRKSINQGKLGWPVGKTLYASKTMIIGFGGIGRELLPRLLAMGSSKVTIICRSIPQDAAEIMTKDSRVEFLEFSSIFGDNIITSPRKLHVDVLFLCCTVNKENVGMVNHKFLGHFQTGLHIVNVSRVSQFEKTYICL